MKMFNGSTNLFLNSLSRNPNYNLEDKSWKDDSNMKTIIVSKNVKNSVPSVDINANCYVNNTEISNPCSKPRNNFKAQPIKHYRKQYTSSTFARNNSVNIMDKPSDNIVTNLNQDLLKENNFNSFLTQYLVNNRNKCCDINDKYKSNSLIKSATTVLDSSYCSTNKQLLYKRCKTFNQNLPLNNNKTKCSLDQFNCNTTFNPSNKRYQVQGPITSSARIAALKYDAGSKQVNEKPVRQCLIRKTDYNNLNYCPENLSLKECDIEKRKQYNPLCFNCNTDKKRFKGGAKIRILS